jgi:hypothetical protein
MRRAFSFTVATVCACAVLAPVNATAQSADTWKWQAAIYGYFPSISGKTKFPSGGSDVGVESDKLLDSLNGAFMGSLEGHYGRWGGLVDFMYLDVSGSKSGTRDATIGGSALPAGASADLQYGLKGTMWTLGGTYRVVQAPEGTMDVLVGARTLDVNQTLGWGLTGNVGSIPVAASGKVEVKATNWDAIIGVRGRYAFGQDRKWFAPYYLDVGTGDSELTWQAMTGIGYSFGWGDLLAAWRYIDYRMKSGSPVQDLTFNGPGIAAVFRW